MFVTYKLMLLVSDKRPSLTKTRQANMAANRKRFFFFLIQRVGDPPQHAGKRRDPDQTKNTLFIPCKGQI